MSRYIDADNIIEKLEAKRDNWDTKNAMHRAMRGAYVDSILIVRDAPTVEAEPIRHGEWVNDTYCSICGRFPVDTSEGISNCRLTKFFERCPHCGSKMKRGEYDV